MQRCRVALAPWIKYHTYRFNYEAQLLWRRKIKRELLCSLAGFLFLDFSWGEFSVSVGVFFLIFFPYSQRLLWLRLFSRREIYKNMPCVSPETLCPRVPRRGLFSTQRSLSSPQGFILASWWKSFLSADGRASRTQLAPGWNGEVKTVKHLLSRGHVTSIRSSSCRRLSQGVRGEIWNVSAINCQRQGSY